MGRGLRPRTPQRLSRGLRQREELPGRRACLEAPSRPRREDGSARRGGHPPALAPARACLRARRPRARPGLRHEPRAGRQGACRAVPEGRWRDPGAQGSRPRDGGGGCKSASDRRRKNFRGNAGRLRWRALKRADRAARGAGADRGRARLSRHLLRPGAGAAHAGTRVRCQGVRDADGDGRARRGTGGIRGHLRRAELSARGSAGDPHEAHVSAGAIRRRNALDGAAPGDAGLPAGDRGVGEAEECLLRLRPRTPGALRRRADGADHRRPRRRPASGDRPDALPRQSLSDPPPQSSPARGEERAPWVRAARSCPTSRTSGSPRTPRRRAPRRRPPRRAGAAPPPRARSAPARRARC